jgi:murein L,D-transpeptidase YcbB/YkuD
VDAYYASRGDAPVWLDHGQWTPAARGAFQRLQAAADDGLDLQAYRVYALDKGPEASLALADIALSEAVAAYAFQASGGRVDPARISRLIGARPHVATAAEALDAIAKAADADATLRGYNPGQPGYLALRQQLAQWRAQPASTPVARLASTEPGRKASDAVATIAPRRAANLEPDILVNMEFWRWLPRDLGLDRVVVNVPEFTARLYRADALAFSTRVIVGKPDKTTPLFSDRIEYLVINPTWNVPQSIIKNEMMSKLDDLRRQGYDVEWVNGRLHVRQPPGERNALGRIKFIFPNDYAVYMHDTPNHNLFAASRRAFSHGCVRVDQPLKLAETLLGPERGWTEARIKKLYGASERRVSLPGPMPIHIVYFTVAVDENGQLQRFEDVYGYAARARALMGLAEAPAGRHAGPSDSDPYRSQSGAATKNRI